MENWELVWISESWIKQPLPFSDEVLNIVVGYEAYPFLDGYSKYYQIFITPKDRYKTTFGIDWWTLV
jgi:hypothetical protein